MHSAGVYGVHMDLVPDRARFSLEAVLFGENCASRSNRCSVRGADPCCMQGHIHGERKKRVSHSDQYMYNKFRKHFFIYNFSEFLC